MFIQLPGSTKTKKDDKGPVPRSTGCTNMHPKGLREWERLQTFDWGCMWDVWSWESDHYLVRSNLAPEMMATNKILLKYEMQEILYSSHGKPFFLVGYVGLCGQSCQRTVLGCPFFFSCRSICQSEDEDEAQHRNCTLNTTDAKKHW